MSEPLLVWFKYDDGPGTPSTELDQNYAFTSRTDNAKIKFISNSLYGWHEFEAKESALLLDLGLGYYTVQLISKSSSYDRVSWIGINYFTAQWSRRTIFNNEATRRSRLFCFIDTNNVRNSITFIE